jgi:hypothetical protein
MKALLSVGIAMAALSSLALAKEERAQETYAVLRHNASIPIDVNFDRSYTIQRDGSLIFHVRDRWYRARLTPPCSSDLYGSLRLGFVHRGPWLDRTSQVIVDGNRCPLRSLDEIADPRPEAEREREAAQAESE